MIFSWSGFGRKMLIKQQGNLSILLEVFLRLPVCTAEESPIVFDPGNEVDKIGDAICHLGPQCEGISEDLLPVGVVIMSMAIQKSEGLLLLLRQVKPGPKIAKGVSITILHDIVKQTHPQQRQPPVQAMDIPEPGQTRYIGRMAKTQFAETLSGTVPVEACEKLCQPVHRRTYLLRRPCQSTHGAQCPGPSRS